jgi:transcriptional regulator with XRE-family HTH domain
VQLIIKKRRIACGYRGKEFAESLGISAAYLSQLEKGVRARPSDFLLQKAASLLNCTVPELFDDGLADGLAAGASSKCVREHPPGYCAAPAAPLQATCRIPASCDLPHDLADVKAQLATLSAQVETLTRLLGATLAANAPSHSHDAAKQKAS